MGAPFIVVSFEGLQTSAVPRPASGSGVVVLSLPRRLYLHLLCFCFTGQPHTVQEYVRVRVQSPTYIGYSPANDISDTFEGWATLYRIASVERSLTRCPPPLRSQCCRITLVHPYREDISIDSRVHGNRTLYAEARPYHYKPNIILVSSEFFFLAGMSREVTRKHC